jgi:hypothetical protein
MFWPTRPSSDVLKYSNMKCSDELKKIILNLDTVARYMLNKSENSNINCNKMLIYNILIKFKVIWWWHDNI